MRENILHFIWQHQYYNFTQAVTYSGDSIQILHQGNQNNNAGPDFEQAKINIGKVEWNGDVEIHLKSSDWKAHKHQFDKSYNRVVLHVVWEHDKEVRREDGTFLPTLVIKELVDNELLHKVDGLINSIEPIPCLSQIHKISKITLIDTIQRALISRLERKSEMVLVELETTKGDWAEVAYRLIMRQMGMKVNGDSFYDLAELVPYKLIRKYSHSQMSLEALLFGVSGLLKMAKDDEYTQFLKGEYAFLIQKHQLLNELKPQQWKFMRLRPSNFPTLRLAQTAALLAQTTNIFELFTSFSDAKEFTRGFELTTSDYWKSHYRFCKLSKKKVPDFGKSSVDLLLLNVVAPLLVAYSKKTDDQVYLNKAIVITEQVKSEKNRIIRQWETVDIHPKNGAESQGLIELYNEHCAAKKCLNCGIGYSILK